MILRTHTEMSGANFRADPEKGTFEGIAAPYGAKGTDGFIILKGAFDYTLRKFGKPKMFFNHDWNAVPIGRYSKVSEETGGLFVAGEFTPGHPLADTVRAGMRHGTIDGLSVGGFVSREDRTEADDGTTTVSRWSKLIEISPVVFPAEDTARVDLSSVRSGEQLLDAIEACETIRDLEHVLRDAGFSRAAGSALISRAKTIAGLSSKASEDDAATKAAAELEAHLRGFAERLGVAV